jgi:hypothetical protein
MRVCVYVCMCDEMWGWMGYFSQPNYSNSRTTTSYLKDLNKVQQKPYTERVEGDGTNDRDVAQEAWTRLGLRDDSKIKDVVGSQVRSQVGTCE